MASIRSSGSRTRRAGRARAGSLAAPVRPGASSGRRPASPAARPGSARRAAWRTRRPADPSSPSDQPPAVLLDELSVELEPAAATEVLDHVPVDARSRFAADVAEAHPDARGEPCPRSSRRRACSACDSGCPGCSRCRTRRAGERPRRCRAWPAGTPRPPWRSRRRSCLPRTGAGSPPPRGRDGRPDTRSSRSSPSAESSIGE